VPERQSVRVAGVGAAVDPYAVLGVARGADEAEIHAAYRDAVRRTHPDAGGSAAAFEAVQEAYEVLRDPAKRGVWDAESPRPRAAPTAGNPDFSSSRMEDLLAESQRLEDEARRLAGMPPRHGGTSSPEGESGDSLAAILRDAGQQLREVAGEGARELRRRIRRVL
jgi:curved DNA-binding protein CbpA